MSGETEQQVSGWTVDTLREYLTTRIEEADKRYEQRYIGSQEAITAALVAQEKAVSAALNAADRAVAKAEIAAEKRFEGTNEFRGQLADQAATLMPRAEAESRIKALADRLDSNTAQHQREWSTLRDELQKAISSLALVQAGTSGRDHGYANFMGYVAVGISLLATVLVIIEKLAK